MPDGGPGIEKLGLGLTCQMGGPGIEILGGGPGIDTWSLDLRQAGACVGKSPAPVQSNPA